ncbi:hypothetical protein HDU85_006854 [Gaertneriomyces sp. JEL0708]|nr:hypothetical protein HDU85_006854 [Gaertneriomyces sp. JEL0708]
MLTLTSIPALPTEQRSRTVSEESTQTCNDPLVSSCNSTEGLPVDYLFDATKHFTDGVQQEPEDPGRYLVQQYQNFVYSKNQELKNIIYNTKEISKSVNDPLEAFCLKKNLENLKSEFEILLAAHEKHSRSVRALISSAVAKNLLSEFSEVIRHSIADLSEQVTADLRRLNDITHLKRHEKVYTIGCFDLFHRGHASLLQSLRSFGECLIVGIHDDHSYFQLKGKYPIDPLEVRIKTLKPHCDMIFIIPSTDPTLYIESMISDQDVERRSACYVRGDDMPEFPSRELVESKMPVYLIPRYHSMSSSLARSILLSTGAVKPCQPGTKSRKPSSQQQDGAETPPQSAKRYNPY